MKGKSTTPNLTAEQTSKFIKICQTSHYSILGTCALYSIYCAPENFHTNESYPSAYQPISLKDGPHCTAQSPRRTATVCDSLDLSLIELPDWYNTLCLPLLDSTLSSRNAFISQDQLFCHRLALPFNSPPSVPCKI